MRTLDPRVWSSLSLLALSVLLPACGSGGSGDTHGPVSVVLTDAASNEVESFVVRITSLTLGKSNGTSVGVLSAPVDVDLADATDTSRLLDSLLVPIGFFSSASITLDFNHVSCMLAGQNTPASITDDQGQALTGLVAYPIQLGSNINVSSALHRLLQVDFDLEQSLQVDSGGNSVALAPVLLLSVDPAAPRPIAVWGTLVSADEPNARFVLELQDANGSPIDQVTCTTDSATVFQTDGVPATGASGMSALAALAAGTWVQGYGSVVPHGAGLALEFVEAGLGTWNGGSDIVEGHVVDRAGGAGADATLTVLGHGSDAAHTSVQWDTLFTVSTSFAGTHVVRLGSATAFDTDDVNIGQHVRLFGALSGATLDASAGVLRLQPTQLFGAAAGVPAGGELTADITRVGLVDRNDFTWSSGGTSPASPSALVSDVGTLADGLGIDAATPVVLHGFFSPVDDDGADFDAVSVANVANTALVLVRNRLLVGFDVALSCSSASIGITISGSAAPGEFAVVDQGFAGQVALPSSPTPTLTPAGSSGLYTIRDHSAGTTITYLGFANFATALGDLVALGAQVRHLSAVGVYQSGSNTLSASAATVVVQ